MIYTSSTKSTSLDTLIQAMSRVFGISTKKLNRLMLQEPEESISTQRRSVVRRDRPAKRAAR